METYTDPSTNSRVELPYGYNDAWTNGTDYVMSGDPHSEIVGEKSGLTSGR